MTEEPLYRIEEQEIAGWVEVATNLPKEECKNLYESLVAQGTNPNYLRIVRVK